MVQSTFQTALAVVPLVMVLAVLYWLRSKWGQMTHRMFGQKDSRGQAVPRTTMARFGGGALPVDADILARASFGAVPRHSLSQTILRPTLGVRIISLAVGVLVLWMLWTAPDQMAFGFPDAVKWALSVSIVYATAYTNTYEARYDADSIQAKDWLFRHTDHTLADLLSIKDNGHYLYVLRFAGGQKLDLQKHLVGIGDFLTIAQMHVAANNRT